MYDDAVALSETLKKYGGSGLKVEERDPRHWRLKASQCSIPRRSRV